MNLHRIEGRADWADVSVSQQNQWQKVAARTHGIVTISNFFSLVGLASIPYGLWALSHEAYITAVIILGLGRLCDLLDGWLADLTHTKSPLGEKIDASFDKISTVATVTGLVVLGVVPGSWLLLLVTPHLLIAPIVVLAYFMGKPAHPSVPGKFSMAVIWATIVGYILLHPLAGQWEDVGKILVAISFYVAVGLGLIALVGYIRHLFASSKAKS
jgi:phosphatidylglycerophosphate synthase